MSIENLAKIAQFLCQLILWRQLMLIFQKYNFISSNSFFLETCQNQCFLKVKLDSLTTHTWLNKSLSLNRWHHSPTSPFVYRVDMFVGIFFALLHKEGFLFFLQLSTLYRRSRNYIISQQQKRRKDERMVIYEMREKEAASENKRKRLRLIFHCESTSQHKIVDD